MRPDRDIVIIIGRRRAGKTFLVKHLFMNRASSVVVDDHTNEYTELPGTKKLQDLLVYPKVAFQDLSADDETFEKMVEIVKQRKKKFKYTLLIIDEAHIHFERRRLPRAQSALLRYGRHFNIGVVLVSHRVYDFNPLVYKLADYVIIFRTTEPRELDFIRKFVGYGAEEKVKQLKQYEFILVNVNEGKVSGPHKLQLRKSRSRR